MSWYDFDLTLDLAIVTLTLNICLGYTLDTVRFRKLILGRDISKGLYVCYIDLTLI